MKVLAIDNAIIYVHWEEDDDNTWHVAYYTSERVANTLAWELKHSPLQYNENLRAPDVLKLTFSSRHIARSIHVKHAIV